MDKGQKEAAAAIEAVRRTAEQLGVLTHWPPHRRWHICLKPTDKIRDGSCLPIAGACTTLYHTVWISGHHPNWKLYLAHEIVLLFWADGLVEFGYSFNIQNEQLVVKSELYQELYEASKRAVAQFREF